MKKVKVYIIYNIRIDKKEKGSCVGILFLLDINI